MQIYSPDTQEDFDNLPTLDEMFPDLIDDKEVNEQW